jgi:gamma-glutamyl:cysteine ligase YbdK (ATP-grasp superfamily)
MANSNNSTVTDALANLRESVADVKYTHEQLETMPKYQKRQVFENDFKAAAYSTDQTIIDTFDKLQMLVRLARD